MYFVLKSVHMVCAALTISGFLLRGYWMFTASALLEQKPTRILPHVIDTVFLLSGVAMLFMLSLNPFTVDWLLAKIAGLIAYILLGMIALRRGPTRGTRVTAFIGAVLVFAYIVGVAISRSPTSWLAFWIGA